MSDPLRTYTFLPWLRQGLGARIETVDPIGPSTGAPMARASLAIDFDVNGTRIEDSVQLFGPGDVLGINPNAVVKTEPRHWVTNFEANHLAYLEFYDEDFPWRYTPATADAVHRLRPWLVLVAVTEAELTEAGLVHATDRDAPAVPVIELTGEPTQIFPPFDQTWAWAHVHASEDVSADGTRSAAQAVAGLKALLGRNPDLASSRLLCARKLRPNTAYHALVLPAFELGRRAALGEATAGVDAFLPSWGNGQTRYPVLYRWYFRCGEGGDFEYLADLLQPRVIPDQVGIRDMDVQRPGFGVRGLSTPPVVGLEGALRKPGAVPRPNAWPPAPGPALVRDLEAKLNLAADLIASPPPGGHPDPVVTLPLYGRWHAMVDRVAANESGWVDQLNGDPRTRAAAGLGTRVVQANQEQYMQRAFAQVGDVIEANRRIRQAQLGLSAGAQMLRKSLRALPDHELLAVTRPVHARVLGSPHTIQHLVAQSRLPDAALEPAFRSLLRPRGRLAKQALREAAARPTDVLVKLNDGTLTAAQPKPKPRGQIALDALAERVAPALPSWLQSLLQQRALLWLLVAIVIVLLFATLGPVVALVAAVAAAVGATQLARVSLQAQAATGLREAALTPAAVDQAPAQPAFRITDPGATTQAPASSTATADSIEARHFRSAARALNTRLSAPERVEPIGAPLDLPNAARKLVRAIDPARALPARLRDALVLSPGREPVTPSPTIAPVMAHPIFKDAMYAPLRDLSPELLLPNLNEIPNNSISLMETNPRFIESYMVGLNQELGRELLWREFPTDQRGSYFRQFWAVADALPSDPSTSEAAREAAQLDIAPIHTWPKPSALGAHPNRDLPSGAEPEPRLVLVVRGDLLKKYPTTVVYAQKAIWSTEPLTGADVRVLDPNNPTVNLRGPVFKAEVSPDVHFFGFDLTQAQARGSRARSEDPGWFVVLQERPGEPRFALDMSDAPAPPPLTRWRELTWNHLGDPEALHAVDLSTAPASAIPAASADSAVSWGSHAADMAYILLQDPVMVAFHAADMLEPIDGSEP